MSVFALPALIALLTKLWVYKLARTNQGSSETFLWMLSFFALHNLAEFIVIFHFFYSGNTQTILLKTYYVTLVFALAYMCILTMSIVNKNRHFYFFAIFIAFLLTLLIYLTDWIIAGVIPLDYTVTAIKGTYYFIFQFGVLFSFIWIIFALTKRYFSTVDLKVQLQCFYSLLALSPVLIVSVLVMAMMQMEYQYTGAMLLPFASTFVLLIIVWTEKDNDFIQISGRLPFSAQRKIEKQIISIFRSHANNELDLIDTKNEMERVLVQYALDDSDSNVSITARKLGVQRSTLYGIFQRLGITYRS